jgi:hypothetical protein
MKRFSRDKTKRSDIENAFGSPAGVEMKDIDSDAPMSTSTPERPSRIVSPPPPLEASSSPDDSPPNIVAQGSADSLFDVEEYRYLEEASASPETTPNPMQSVLDDKYKTPDKAAEETSNLSTGSSFGHMVQFNSINFSPDFSVTPGAVPPKPPNDSMSDRSSDAGSVKEPFVDQIETLNNLLTTPVRALGAFADTTLSPDAEDDYLDQEMEDLEDNSRLLNRELSQVDWSLLPGETPETSHSQASKQLFSPSPEKPSSTKQQQGGQLFSPSPGQVHPMISPIPLDGSHLTNTPIPVDTSDVTPRPSDEKTPRDASKEKLESYSYSLSKMFGFRKTPMPKAKDQLGIARKTTDSQAAASEEDDSLNVSSMGVSSTSGDSIFQSLANFSSMYGDHLPSPDKSRRTTEAGYLLDDDNNKKTTSQSIAEETVEFSGGSFQSPPYPDDELSMNKLPSGQKQSIRSFDAGTSSSTPMQQSKNSSSKRKPRKWFGRNLGTHDASPGLPSPAGFHSPLVYADDDDEEEGYFLSTETPPRKLDYSSLQKKETTAGFKVYKPTQDFEVGETDEPEKLKEPKNRFELTSRHIGCICGLAVVVIVCALLIALFATDILRNMDDEERTAPSPFPSLSISPTLAPTESFKPTISLGPSPSPTTSPSSSPTKVIQKLTTSYNIVVSNGLVDAIPSDDYTPDLIKSMDKLSLVVLENMQDGGASNGVSRRRLTVVLLPSTIASIAEAECPDSTGRDRCERITAEISLSDATESVQAFKTTLEVAITIGGLQFYLDRVNPDSIVSIQQASSIGPTPVPPKHSSAPTTDTELPTEPPNVAPSSLPTVLLTETNSALPTSSPTINPTKSQSIGPSTSPTSNPTKSPAMAPTVAYSRVPTSTPTKNPTMSPTKTQSLVPTLTPTLNPTSRPTTMPTVPNPVLFDFLVQNSFDEGRALSDPSSPQYRAFGWLALNRNLESYSEARRLQRYALATLYYSTNGDEWLNKGNWMSDANECGWFSKAGLGPCNAPGSEVKNFELDYNNLNGVMPAELALLSNSLERIVLHGGPSEALDGSIPTEFGYLTNLRLVYLPNNSLTGTFPSEMGRLTNLQQMNLSNNQLKGALPSEIGNLRNLITIDISENSFTGQLPKEVGNMEKCNKLLLDDNILSGPIPSQIGQLRRLQELSASMNSFTSIPSEIGELAFCDTISLQDNDIRGTIPIELGDLRRLSKFYILSVCVIQASSLSCINLVFC